MKYINPRKHNILNSGDVDHSPAKLSKLEQLYAQTVTPKQEADQKAKKKVVLYRTDSSDTSTDSSSSESDDEQDASPQVNFSAEKPDTKPNSKYTAQEWAEYYSMFRITCFI